VGGRRWRDVYGQSNMRKGRRGRGGGEVGRERRGKEGEKR